MSSALPDAEARRRIAEELDHSLVVVAGAGTGKTTALVGRVVELVRRGAPLRELAVITFTEAAAAELRVRLAEALAAARDAEPANRTLASAVEEVDEAAVCTLHAFAQRILVEHALAAGLPPGFDVLDELSDRAEVEARLADFTDRLLDDPEAQSMLLRGFVLGLGEASMFELAWCLHTHWDRLEDGGLERIEAARPRPDAWPAVDVAPVLAAVDRALAMGGWCCEADDLLLGHLHGPLTQAHTVLVAAAHDEQAALPLLVRLPGFGFTRGRREHWDGHIGEVRQACAEAESARRDLLAEVRAPVLAELLARLARFTTECAHQRAVEGRLTFHDLLVHARRLLRTDEAARGALRRRYRWLLVDEFQDTDPLQVELAAWLASAVEGGGDLGDARPGAMFVVGDPKQSIYRFRRADIELFEQVTAAVGEEVVLGANFRSVPGIVRFVNTLFPELFGYRPEPGQAVYHPLAAVRRGMPGHPGTSAVQLSLAGMGTGEPDPVDVAPAPVVVLGGAVEGSLGEVRRAGAADLALAVRRALSESWPVSDADDPACPPRPARWSDVAVLIPTRTSLGVLEEAFDDAGIPYRLEGAALLWGSEEVGDVLAALAAADEPSDAVAVLAALRSPGLACGDDDLVGWHAAGGSWDPRAAAPAGTERHPVTRAMAVLDDLHRRRWWSEPSALVMAATEALNGYALAFAHRRPRQGFQRLSWLADQARLFDETVGGSLHDFLRWAELQREGDGRTASLGPPEADDDAVRVMTVHGAKGLEFPVVALAGLERDDITGYRAEAVLWRPDGEAEVGLGLNLRSGGYEAALAADRELDRLERVRLLYVAMTRARDHLVLCLHHRVRSASADQSHAAVLEELCRAHPLLWRRLPELDVDPGDRLVDRRHGVAGGGAPGNPEAARRWASEVDRWSLRRADTVARLRALPVVTASALAHSSPTGHSSATAPAPSGVDPGWRGQEAPTTGGDVGLRMGRAVHGALAAVDLASGHDPFGADAVSVSRHHAQLHGVGEHAGAVASMVEAALSSSLVRWAAGRRHHKEAFLGRPVGDDAEGVFEGFVDLLVEDDEGLVVVDYKTDRISDQASFDRLATGYAKQVAAYALAAEAATGRPTTRAVLLFLEPGRAAEHVLDDAALASARALADHEMSALIGAL